MNTRELTIDDIPFDRWITRGELHAITGQCDRVNRDQINEMRKHPETLIISSSKHKGYKRPRTLEELELCLNESRSRVRDETSKQRVLEAAIRQMREGSRGGQLLLDF